TRQPVAVREVAEHVIVGTIFHHQYDEMLYRGFLNAHEYSLYFYDSRIEVQRQTVFKCFL
ncbi:MAG TPA: hypothetical protein VLD65_10295, partial [Anaerolineales bacterium]|nr:hypothetical protein [Anaerolineales bacterium]